MSWHNYKVKTSNGILRANIKGTEGTYRVCKITLNNKLVSKVGIEYNSLEGVVDSIRGKYVSSTL